MGCCHSDPERSEGEESTPGGADSSSPRPDGAPQNDIIKHPPMGMGESPGPKSPGETGIQGVERSQ
jgi:hypothetical protein